MTQHVLQFLFMRVEQIVQVGDLCAEGGQSLRTTRVIREAAERATKVETSPASVSPSGCTDVYLDENHNRPTAKTTTMMKALRMLTPPPLAAWPFAGFSRSREVAGNGSDPDFVSAPLLAANPADAPLRAAADAS
eukprot:CAMPEP_0204289006 /NCGR_PEP_ID=MMETSP0468-20130131/57877_1 /ASSEMBLY_ACC=CAM_ASM_000383 /TAXON_ID=2969 /ORGANISM="Oxyrrhis marina" /LENGTH=134 /DNA_ID=CAMNT_0051267137 /DNA_START=661 /DNA_END=1066 /DNA_ORIENTATION=-